jgi:hypothetical protein
LDDPYEERRMKVQKGIMVALGYGKYFKSDSIMGLEPIEEGRGPGRRTKVYINGIAEPLVASRSEGAILRDMVEAASEITRVREQNQLLADVLDTVSEVDPILRAIIHDQGKWNLDRLEERIAEVLGESD